MSGGRGETEDPCKLPARARPFSAPPALRPLIPGPKPAAPGELAAVIGGSPGQAIDDRGVLISRKHRGCRGHLGVIIRARRDSEFPRLLTGSNKSCRLGGVQIKENELLKRELYYPDGVRGLAGGVGLQTPGRSAASHLSAGSEIGQGHGADSRILASVKCTPPLQISYTPETATQALSVEPPARGGPSWERGALKRPVFNATEPLGDKERFLWAGKPKPGRYTRGYKGGRQCNPIIMLSAVTLSQAVGRTPCWQPNFCCWHFQLNCR